MYSASEYLSHRSDDRRVAAEINRPMSGGLPHSEIPGSQGALASPGLIAECHVLHRLLPPRHPPNALFALDPIQKTEDRLLLSSATTPRQGQGRGSSVSVDLDSERHAPSARSKPNAAHIRISLHDVKGPRKVQTNDQVKWWVWEDSNLRPYAYQAYALTT